MSAPSETISTPTPDEADLAERLKYGREAARALMREHPDAVIYALTSDGLVAPIPESLQLDGYPVLAMDGRSGTDFFVGDDRVAAVYAWTRAKKETVAQVHVRLCSQPEQWMVMRLLDLRPTHGVVLHVLWPTSEAADDAEEIVASAAASAAPRFCTRKQDEEGNVLECDDAYLEMFGFSAEEVIGLPTFERVHPDDQARVIEGWIAMIATGRTQMFRVRARRRDGSWLWVDTTLHNYLKEEPQGYVLAESIDVSAEMRAQEALQDREELLRNLIEEMPDGLLQLDAERQVIYHNPRLLELLCGRARAAQDGDSQSDGSAPRRRRAPELLELAQLIETLTDEAREAFDAAIGQALIEGLRQDIEVEAVLPSGAQRLILMKIRPLQRESGAVSGVIASVLDVTDAARARRELEKRATFDALTGAHNRASIMAALAAELEASPETGVIYVDLDRFKSVNDTLGHAAGDEVLVHVAECLRAAMRASDELGRLGGDEFLILLRGVGGLDVAMSAAERISESVRGTYELACGEVELCASVGVACVDGGDTVPDELVERADAAMYRSKEERRGVPVLAA